MVTWGCKISSLLWINFNSNCLGLGFSSFLQAAMALDKVLFKTDCMLAIVFSKAWKKGKNQFWRRLWSWKMFLVTLEFNPFKCIVHDALLPLFESHWKKSQFWSKEAKGLFSDFSKQCRNLYVNLCTYQLYIKVSKLQPSRDQSGEKVSCAHKMPRKRWILDFGTFIGPTRTLTAG